MPLIKRIRFCSPLVDPLELNKYLSDALTALQIDDAEKARSVLLQLKDEIDKEIYK